MVEFVLDLWKKVVIHEISKFDLDDLLKLHILGGIGIPLLWANGVVFEHNNMMPTKDVVEAQFGGTVHWVSLQFAFMPEYKNLIMMDNIPLRIGNVDRNKLFFEMADWLKGRYKEET